MARDAWQGRGSTEMLAQWNREFEAGSSALPPEVWDMWLWNSDMHEPLTPAVVLTRNHLLGLLVARYKGKYSPHLMRVRLMDLFPTIVHGSAVVADMTLRQLRDATEDIQMHWAEYTEKDWEYTSRAVDALMTRFGELNLAPAHSALRDDPPSLDVERPGWMTPVALRRFVSIFCVLYRHLHLAASVEELTDTTPHPEVENYHIQAGMEEFYRHGMLVDLPPAARIMYKLDFQGMYHCVTQVVYMHFPSYDRRRQVDLERIRASDVESFHLLSALLQISPDSHFVYEDESLRPGWNWVLLAGGALYLVECHSSKSMAVSIGRVIACACVWTLFALATKDV